MALLVTLDASVFVSACRRGEPGHRASRALLQQLREDAVPLIEPTLLPVEIAAALTRTGDDPGLAMEYAEAVTALPQLTWVTLDAMQARRAVLTAATHRLRAADALYIAAARQYGSRLVTLDKEQLRRAPSSLGACGPDKALG
jgi:predicted nucleic acid-binding protein